MDDFSKLMDAIGVLSEISAIYYNSLVRAGLPEAHAVSLTAKIMGEIMRSTIDGNSKEDKHE